MNVSIPAHRPFASGLCDDAAAALPVTAASSAADGAMDKPFPSRLVAGPAPVEDRDSLLLTKSAPAAALPPVTCAVGSTSAAVATSAGCAAHAQMENRQKLYDPEQNSRSGSLRRTLGRSAGRTSTLARCRTLCSCQTRLEIR